MSANITTTCSSQGLYLCLPGNVTLVPEITLNIFERIYLSSKDPESYCKVAKVSRLFHYGLKKSKQSLTNAWATAEKNLEIKEFATQFPHLSVYTRMQEVGFTQADLSTDREKTIDNLVKKIKDCYSSCISHYDEILNKSSIADIIQITASEQKLFLSSKKIRMLPPEILPPGTVELFSLTDLDLSNNQLTTLPDSFGRLSSLAILDLSNNQLKILPESFGGLTKLINLRLNDNQLTTLPDSFGRLTNLKTLLLSNNQLKILPESFGRLSSLEVLDLSSNQLKTLPESFCEQGWLLFLNLGGNQLQTLPRSFGRLSSLLSLELSDNQLKILPESFIQLSKLILLDLSGNDDFCQVFDLKPFKCLQRNGRIRLMQLFEKVEQSPVYQAFQAQKREELKQLQESHIHELKGLNQRIELQESHIHKLTQVKESQAHELIELRELKKSQEIQAQKLKESEEFAEKYHADLLYPQFFM